MGTVISIQGQNFNAANKVISKITAVGLNYFEITNASGVAENDKTIGNGFIATGFLWTKPTNLVALYLAGIGGGGQGDQSTSNPDNDAGGGAAAVAEAFFTAAELAASEYYVIPGLGGKGFPTTQTQHVGTPSSFGTQTLTLVRADGATGRIGATTGLIPTNGILTPGQDGENANSSRGSGMGAQSRWGKGGQPANNSQNPGAGYGSGGSGGTTNSTTDVAGGDGAPGMWDFTEIY